MLKNHDGRLVVVFKFGTLPCPGTIRERRTMRTTGLWEGVGSPVGRVLKIRDAARLGRRLAQVWGRA
eukprot:144820-Pyramimonas_sp.AAC.1